MPSKVLLNTPKNVALDYEDIYITTEDNVKIHGWLIKAHDARATLLFFHGNAGNIGDRLDKIRYFHDLKLNVLIVDYRGYGKSGGQPTEEGIYLDAQAAFDYLNKRRDIDVAKIIIYGASLGGAVAVDLASKRESFGLIIDSTFTNAADMAKLIIPFVPSFLIKTKLDSLSKIKNIDTPKLFIHSSEDNTVAYSLGRKLFDAALEPKFFVTISGDHNDGYVLDQEIFMDGILDFIEELYSIVKN